MFSFRLNLDVLKHCSQKQKYKKQRYELAQQYDSGSSQMNWDQCHSPNPAKKGETKRVETCTFFIFFLFSHLFPLSFAKFKSPDIFAANKTDCNMKKIVMSLCGVLAIYGASAQFYAGAFGNYTMYKQSFQKNTPGAGIRVYYDHSEKNSFSLGFTYGSPINFESSVDLQNNNDFNDVQTKDSEIRYKFKTFSLLAHYCFIGDDESTARFYGSFGPGFVLVNYDEKVKGGYDESNFTPLNQVNGNESGFIINLGLGGEYRLGTPSIFMEAGLGFPANKVGNTYVENYIPTHFMLNAGIKFPLGGYSDY